MASSQLHRSGLDDLLNQWRRSKAGLRPATERKLDTYLTATRRYVNTCLPVTDYKPHMIRDDIARARADKTKGQRRLKGQTINEAILGPLREAFKLAEEEGYISKNPISLISHEKTSPINRNQLSWADAERALAEVKANNPESYLEIKFMLYLGVGQAEATSFRGEMVDWENGGITFIRRKTDKQYVVPIYPWAKEFLENEIRPHLPEGRPFFVWRNPRKAWETACRRLKLPVLELRSLRRTLIIRLLEQHTDIRLIAKWQGHADARLILSRYGNYIGADYEKQAVAALKD